MKLPIATLCYSCSQAFARLRVGPVMTEKPKTILYPADVFVRGLPKTLYQIPFPQALQLN